MNPTQVMMTPGSEMKIQMPRLIALNGRLHSGKDTAVQYIQAAAGSQTVRRIAFADKLKMSAAAALGYAPADVDEAVQICNDLKENCRIIIDGGGEQADVITGRQYLQWYGTEAHRQVFADSFWVDALLPRPVGDKSIAGEGPWTEEDGRRANQIVLSQRFPDTDVLVVTDCRFPNEAKRVLDLGGEVWHIDAEERLGPLPANAHVSEHPLPPDYITLVIDNNETLDQFKDEIGEAWQMMSLM